jgi:hypothetical protein
MSIHQGGFHGQAGWKLYASALLTMAWLGGCAPTLNWREVVLRDGAKASFPCRPLSDERTLMLAGRSVAMRLQVCEAGDALWAVSSAGVADARQAAQALAELQQALAINLGGTARVVAPAYEGTQPARVAVEGHHPDGRPLQARAVFVSRGRNVFQFVVVPRAGAPAPDAGAQDQFFDSLR